MNALTHRSLRGPVVGVLLIVLAGCASAPIVTPEGQPEEPVFAYDRVVPPDVDQALLIHDPWEPMNRSIYRFNARVDKYFLLPVIRGYQFVFPGFLRTGISNFFNNFFEIRTFANQILQARPKPAGQTLGRFAVNTTVGILGLIDVASPMGIPYHQEDFGQTLGRWGVGAGPFLVIPVLGPSSLRDGFGTLTDALWMAALDPLGLDDSQTARLVYYPLYIIDTRQNVAFRYYQTGSPFEYELVRLMITTKRELDVAK